MINFKLSYKVLVIKILYNFRQSYLSKVKHINRREKPHGKENRPIGRMKVIFKLEPFMLMGFLFHIVQEGLNAF